MSERPIIGVVPLWDSEKSSLWMLPGYMDGLIEAGAVPVMLPMASDDSAMRSIIDRLDGFLLTGGQDVSYLLYGEPRHEKCGEICDMRDKMELALAKRALEADKPLFGICRGLQFLNVFCGGTLYQDLPSEFDSSIGHDMVAPYDRAVHSVELNSYLAKLLGADKLEVNSLHHQGIKALAPSLEACAKASDGLIEAVRAPGRNFILAVQWHPEFALEWESSKKLFLAFVKACSQ